MSDHNERTFRQLCNSSKMFSIPQTCTSCPMSYHCPFETSHSPCTSLHITFLTSMSSHTLCTLHCRRFVPLMMESGPWAPETGTSFPRHMQVYARLSLRDLSTPPRWDGPYEPCPCLTRFVFPSPRWSQVAAQLRHSDSLAESGRDRRFFGRCVHGMLGVRKLFGRS